MRVQYAAYACGVTTFTYRRFGSVIVVDIVVIAAVIIIVVDDVDTIGVLVVMVVMMTQEIGCISVAVKFGGRCQRDVRLKTPAELFRLRVRYDFLRVH